jgi:hypothetical protein
MKPVIIIGAGLSGLSCATYLNKAGREFVILERNDKVGGRVVSHRTEEGFLIDEGFQVLLSSYPELKSVVSIDKLNLQPFRSGALIFNGKKLDLLANPFRYPKGLLKTLSFPYASLKDKALVVSLLLSSQFFKSDSPWGSTSTLNFLKQFGFSDSFIENFWRPFMAGVYLDQSLSPGSDYFQFLVHCFGRGQVAIPEKGMEQLPREIASHLPQGSIQLQSNVKKWGAEGVTLENGKTVEGSAVVCAFSETPSRKVTTYSFTSPHLDHLGWDKWLILVPQHLGYSVTHLALISSVAKSYGSDEKPLLSVSVVGDKKVDTKVVMEEVEKIAGKKLELKCVAVTEVPHALPIISGETPGFELREGVVYCGDGYASPSINGALRSGRLAAQYLLRK